LRALGQCKLFVDRVGDEISRNITQKGKKSEAHIFEAIQRIACGMLRAQFMSKDIVLESAIGCVVSFRHRYGGIERGKVEQRRLASDVSFPENTEWPKNSS